MTIVEVADIAAPNRLHHQADAGMPIGSSEQMNMVGHEYPRMNRHAVFVGVIAQPLPKGEHVLLVCEADLAVIASLD